MGRGYPCVRMDREDGRVGGGKLIPVAETFDEKEGHKPSFPNVQGGGINTAAGGSMLSVVGVYRRPRGREWFPFLGVVRVSADKPLILRIVTPLRLTRFEEDIFEHGLLQFVHLKEAVLRATQATRWRFSQASSVLDLELIRTPIDMESSKMEEEMGRL